MFSRVMGFVSTDMAIDLGTANTLIYVPGRGIVVDEPSVVAIAQRENGREVIAVGQEAKSMLGRTPDSIEIVQPMRDGVIADFAAAEEMIKHFIRLAQGRRRFGSPRIMICVPASATPVERRAVYEAALVAGARRVYVIEEPVAAALGANLPISEPRGSMIVDIGGGTTDIAVLSLGGVIYSNSLRTAESIKKEAGTAINKVNGTHVAVHIKGRDLQRGFPTEIKLQTHDIAEALSPPLQLIIDGIQRALNDIPPELAGDICESGVYLTGGGALLDRLDARLSNETGIKFKIAEDPLRCVVRGSGIALEKLDTLGDLLIKP